MPDRKTITIDEDVYRRLDSDKPDSWTWNEYFDRLVAESRQNRTTSQTESLLDEL